ncbi:hypothetical protein OKW39_000015 [Paraburkholderia sp. MM6662-R1]
MRWRGRYTHICTPTAMTMETARTHSSMAVKWGYPIFFIVFLSLCPAA